MLNSSLRILVLYGISKVREHIIIIEKETTNLYHQVLRKLLTYRVRCYAKPSVNLAKR